MPAFPGCPGKKAVKRMWCSSSCGVLCACQCGYYSLYWGHSGWFLFFLSLWLGFIFELTNRCREAVNVFTLTNCWRWWWLLFQCPMFKIEETQTVPEPFAEEAKYFTEVRLLQRDVKIVLEGASNQNLLGTVLHPVNASDSCFSATLSQIMLDQPWIDSHWEVSESLVVP